MLAIITLTGGWEIIFYCMCIYIVMNELLGDVANAIEKGESDKCKITIKVEEL